MKTRNLIFQIVGLTVAITLAIFSLVPIYYLIVTTFKSGAEAASYPMHLPSRWDLTKYVQAFNDMHFPRAFMNTFFITAMSVLLITLIASMGGYVFNRRSHKKVVASLFLLVLAGMMYPFQMSMLGLYKVITGLHLMDSPWAVICMNVAMGIPFATFLYQSFMSTIPRDLEEAAYIDGAGTIKTYWTIVFPLLKPIIATNVILNTLTIWNDYMGPLYFIQSREKQVILQEINRNIGQFSVDWTRMFPMMLLGVLPLLLFYVFMQRYIIGGVMGGSVKG